MIQLNAVDFSECPVMDRDIIVPLDDVFTNMSFGKNSSNACMDFGGDSVKMFSQRYKVFSKSTVCVTCECDGTFFVKEKHASIERFHLNLYAIVDGKAIMMTKGHIIPRARGGKDHLSNYQTMCAPCNNEKGSEII